MILKQKQDAFRDVDKDKNGVLQPEEVGMAMASLDIPIDKRIIERLMSRCEDPTQMTMQEFKDLLWIDDTMETYIDDRKNRRAGVRFRNRPAAAPFSTLDRLVDLHAIHALATCLCGYNRWRRGGGERKTGAHPRVRMGVGDAGAGFARGRDSGAGACASVGCWER